MTIYSRTLNIKEGTPQSCAQAIWDLFIHTYAEALRKECTATADYESKLVANKVYKQKWEEETGGLGFGPTGKPNDEATLEYAESKITQAKADVVECEIMLKFLRDRFLAGFEVIPIKR